MANVLTWGKPTIEWGILGEADAAPETFTSFSNPVEGSTQLTTTEGTLTEANAEGGELVDARKSINKYVFEFELYAVGTKPIADTDGVISGNYAVRLTPEDNTLKGFIIDKTLVSVQETYDASIGKKWKYTFNALKPLTGAFLKEYTYSEE